MPYGFSLDLVDYPSELENAKCATSTPSPEDYYVTNTDLSKKNKADTIVRCWELCHDCPALQACAKYALDNRFNSVILAGVPISGRHVFHNPPTPYLLALQMVADGEPLYKASALMLDQHRVERNHIVKLGKQYEESKTAKSA